MTSIVSKQGFSSSSQKIVNYREYPCSALEFDVEPFFKLSDGRFVVCQIMLGNGQRGTGFLIGEDLILTNNHVLPNEETARKAKAVFFHTTEGVEVDIDPDSFFSTSPATDLLGFKPMTMNQLDFTIVSIKSHSKIAEVQHLAFCIFGSQMPVNVRHANIILYPIEENGIRYQKISFRDNVYKNLNAICKHLETAGHLNFVNARYEACQLDHLKENYPENLDAMPMVLCNTPFLIITVFTQEQIEAYVQAHRYKPQFYLVMGMLAGCMWKESMGNIKKLEAFFEWLYSGHVDIIGCYQIKLVLACLEKCGSEKLEEVIWKRCKIADFVDDALKSKKTRECLIRLMAVSKRMFEQVKEIVLEEDIEEQEQLIWFFGNLEKCVRGEYLLNLIQTVLTHKNDKVHFAVGNALREAAIHVEEKYIPKMFELSLMALNDESWTKDYALSTLRAVIDRASEESIPEILQSLETALSYEGKYVGYVVTCILGKIAARTNEQIIFEIMGWLQAALKATNENTRRGAVRALGDIAEYADEKSILKILRWLQTALIDEDECVRASSAESLGRIAAYVNKEWILNIFNRLKIALSDSKLDVRVAALKAIEEVACANGEVFDTILDQLQQALKKDTSKGEITPKILVKIAAHVDKDKIPEILNCFLIALGDNMCCHEGTIEAFGEMIALTKAKLSQTILIWLRRALADGRNYVRKAAVKAIEKAIIDIDKESVPGILDELIQMAQIDKDDGVHKVVINTLGENAAYIHRRSIPAIIDQLQKSLRGQDEDTRYVSLKALGEVTAHAPEAFVPIFLCGIRQFLNSEKNGLRRCDTIKILGNFAIYANEKFILGVLKLLQFSLGDKYENVRRLASTAIVEVAAYANKRTVPKILDWILEALGNQDNDVREVAEKALYRIDKQILTSIFISPSTYYSALKPLIFEHFISQCIPLYLVETDTGCFIQTDEFNVHPFDLSQKL